MGSVLGLSNTSSRTKPDAKLRVQTSLAGLPLAVGWGQFRASWNLLDYDDFKSKQKSAGGKGGVAGGGGKGGGGTYNYSATVLGALCEGPISVLNVWNNQTKQTPASLGLTVLSGTYTQSPWSYMVSAHSAKADAYRGLGCVGASNFPLGDSATLPNLSFEVLNLSFNGAIPGSPDADPKDVITQTLTNANYGVGFPAAQLAALSNYSAYCRATGLVVSPILTNSTTAQSFLSDLLEATNSEARVSGGVFDIIPRGDSDITANGATYTAPAVPIYDLIDADFLPSGEAKPIKIARKRASDQYNDVGVQFLNRAQDYNQDVARAFDDAAAAAFGRRSLSPKNWPFFALSGAAQMAAQLLLGRQHYRNEYSFSLGRRFVRLDCLDIISLTHAGQGIADVWVKITGIDRNSDGTFNVTAEDYLPGTGAAPLYGQQANAGTQINYNISPGSVNTPVVLTAPYQIAETGGLEEWIIVSGSSAAWGGCQVWISVDNAGYRFVGEVTSKARQGVLSASLAQAADPDTTHTLAVNLSQSAGTLTSPGHPAADASQSLAFVDGEILAYGTTSLTGANAYNLTYLRRGLYGTTNSNHASGGEFALLDGNGLFVYPYSKDQIGKTVYLKLLSFNIYGQALQGLSDVSSVAIVLNGAPTDYTPSSLTASPTIRGALLKWLNAPNVGVEAVEIWRSTSSAFSGASKIADAPAYSTSYEDKSVTSNVPYWYWVRYRDIAGNVGNFFPASTGAGATCTTGQVQTGDVGDGTITGPKIADGTIDPIAKFIAGMDAIKIVAGSTLPVSKSTNLIFLLGTAKLYRWDSTAGAYIASVDSTDITGSVTATVADASLTTAKFAAGIEPVTIVAGSTVPTTKSTSTIFLAGTAKLYRWDSGSGAYVTTVATVDLSGTISGTQIANAAISTAKFAAGLTPVEIVSTLPSTGNFEGRQALLTTDGKLYRYHTSAWIKSLDGADIAAATVTGTAIAAATITSGNIAAGTITATNIAADTITAAQIAAGAISASELAAGAVTAGKISAGTVTATEIAAFTITGTNIAGSTITGSNIAGGTITGSNIAGDTITGGQIAAGAISTSELAAGAVTAAQIAAGTITGDRLVANTITGGIIAGGTITAAHMAASGFTADMITTGTINAAIVNVTNLNASNITVGTLTADVIVSNSLTRFDYVSATPQSPVSDALVEPADAFQVTTDTSRYLLPSWNAVPVGKTSLLLIVTGMYKTTSGSTTWITAGFDFNNSSANREIQFYDRQSTVNSIGTFTLITLITGGTVIPWLKSNGQTINVKSVKIVAFAQK